MAVSHVDAQGFAQDVLGASEPVIVDFWAAWCGPCRMVAPELEKADARLAGTAKVVKVNVDEQPSLASRYGVMSIPTLVIFHQGQEVGRHVGYITADALANSVEDYMKKAA